MGEDGVVCFQATLIAGGTGIFIGDGARLVCIHSEPGWEHISHPDRNSKGEVCFMPGSPMEKVGFF
jgi:hypothetical protein